jgi:hypothetical protein
MDDAALVQSGRQKRGQIPTIGARKQQAKRGIGRQKKPPANRRLDKVDLA